MAKWFDYESTRPSYEEAARLPRRKEVLNPYWASTFYLGEVEDEGAQAELTSAGWYRPGFRIYVSAGYKYAIEAKIFTFAL